MYKKYMLIADWEIDEWIGEWEKEYKFFFDTEEEMIDFVKNGDKVLGLKPSQIRVVAAFKLDKLDNNMFCK